MNRTYLTIFYFLTVCFLAIPPITSSNQLEGFDVQLNTCSVCQRSNGDKIMTRFKACKLLTLQKTLKKCLKQLKFLEKEMSSKFNIPFEHRQVDESRFLKVDQFINTTYSRIQRIYLAQQIALRFKREYYLDIPLESVSLRLEQLLCELEPILRSGNFYVRHIFENKCTVSAFLPMDKFGRTDGLNFITNLVLHSTHILQTSIGNIGEILKNV